MRFLASLCTGFDVGTLSKCGASPLGGHKLPLDVGVIAAIDWASLLQLDHAWGQPIQRNDDSAPKSTILAEEQRIYGGFGKIATQPGKRVGPGAVNLPRR